ncbi:hypothetical protein CAPTEDRAFT_195357 [Capitella teleta]|uniref:Amino acid permease/ SLC12A domain-containing protein n=1 Tax=Capitella teleta TaxID=283909 RepID=R7TIQ4_CAPTE|nr:hypothetical protein CAPTEDRAFT_195357 [Capitella teleta]|eukprot:ELT91421.1 hypothetical protein CAPTEDRAFT_195357 [Capitella teleta]
MAEEVEVEEIQLPRRLTLTKGVAMLFGGVVGSGIFISPSGVLYYTQSVGLSLIIWVVCGIACMIGNLSYIELALMLKKNGGSYTFIRASFGEAFAFMNVTVNIVFLRPAGLAIMAMTFANYALYLGFDDGCGNPPDYLVKMLAIAAICEYCQDVVWDVTVVCLAGLGCFVNMVNVTWALRLGVLFFVCKLAAVSLIAVGGLVKLFQGHTEYLSTGFENTSSDIGDIALSIYAGMWAYTGWSLAAEILEELENPAKGMWRVSFTSISLVNIVYILCNVSYLTVLSPNELISSPAVAVSWAEKVISDLSWALPVLIATSVLGSILISLFNYSRLVHRVARDGLFVKVFGMIHVDQLTPTPGLLLSAVIPCLFVLPSDVSSLMSFFSFLEWFWHGVNFLIVIYFRIRRPEMPRPYKAPLLAVVGMLLFSVFLVLTPLIMDPIIQNFYAVLGIISSLLIYFPFIYFGLSIPGTGKYRKYKKKKEEMAAQEEIDKWHHGVDWMRRSNQEALTGMDREGPRPPLRASLITWLPGNAAQCAEESIKGRKGDEVIARRPPEVGDNRRKRNHVPDSSNTTARTRKRRDEEKWRRENAGSDWDKSGNFVMTSYERGAI